MLSLSTVCLVCCVLFKEFCISWWCSEMKGGIFGNLFCKKHTNLCKYWSKWRRCFLGFSKYYCQVCFRVLVQLLRNGSMWMFLKLCAWPLKTSDGWCLCQKDGGTQRKQQKIRSFGPGILCCFTIAAVFGTRACLHCRLCKNRRLCTCVGLLICSLILSLSSQETQMVTRSSLVVIHYSAQKASGALCVKCWRRQGWVRRRLYQHCWALGLCPRHSSEGKASVWAGHFRGQVMNEGNYRLRESVL